MVCQILSLAFLVRVDKGFLCQERIGEGPRRTNQTVPRCFQEEPWGRSKQRSEGCGAVSLRPGGALSYPSRCPTQWSLLNPSHYLPFKCLLFSRFLSCPIAFLLSMFFLVDLEILELSFMISEGLILG